MSALRRVLGLPWEAVAAVRGRRQAGSAQHAAVPVICIGNLTMGGTGKTPAALWVVEALAPRKAGLLRRGYGAAAGAPGDEESAWLAAALGDGGLVHESPDRVAGAAALVERGAEVIVMDDGFQHRRLARDLDVVLVDATRPWGGGGCPPGGLLREGPAALGRAGAVVLTRTDQVQESLLEGLRSEARRRAPDAVHAEAQHSFAGLRDAATGTPATAAGLGPVTLVSAIGNPDAFEATARSTGLEVVAHRRFRDHHAYRVTDLDGLEPGRWVTTAKDAVKLPAADEDMRPLVLDVEFQVTRGEDDLRALLLKAARGDLR